MKLFWTFLICVTFISCTKEKSETKDTLNYALSGKVSTLDPAVSYDTISARVVSQIYESLYEYDYLIRPYQLKPNLAKSMPLVENNGLKYTIQLKKGIKYHKHAAFAGKTRTVKAQDFINQIKRMAYKPTGSNGWWLFDGKIKGLNKFRNEVGSDLKNFFTFPVEGLKSPNDHTLVIELTQPYPQLMYALAMAFTTPVPEEIISHYKNNLNQEGVGTGPYKFIEWKKGAFITLVKNQNYHEVYYPTKGDRFSYENDLLKDAGKRLPFIEKINFQIMKEAQTRWLNFRSKKTDLVVLTKDHFSLALDNTGRLNKEFTKQGIKLQIAPTLTYWWLAFNMKDPILGKNLKLRQAFAHAINIDEYIKSFTNNIAQKANSIYPPGINGYSPKNELPYKYDIELAKKLLKEAGYPEGKGLPEFSYDVRGSSTVSRQMGEFIQKELAKVGIKITVNLNTFPNFLKKARTGQLQIWPGGWAMDYPDPENIIQLLITKNHAPGPNSTYYSNPKVDELYAQLGSANTKEKVLEITKKVEKIMGEELPWVMQYYSRNYILHHGYLKNFRQSDLISNNFKYLKLE